MTELTSGQPKMLTDAEAAMEALIQAAPEPLRSHLRDSPLTIAEKGEILEEVLRQKAAH
ncbi:MAG TPA: hypothetical protein VMU40_07785 [Steroidobacteraceae bacterium]|nr:hypothetical protein [Steroidobacteraceae bacterium]